MDLSRVVVPGILGILLFLAAVIFIRWRRSRDKESNQILDRLRFELQQKCQSKAIWGDFDNFEREVKSQKDKLRSYDYNQLLIEIAHQKGLLEGQELGKKAASQEFLRMIPLVAPYLTFEVFDVLITNGDPWRLFDIESTPLLGEDAEVVRQRFHELLAERLGGLLDAGGEEEFLAALDTRKRLLAVKGFTVEDFGCVVSRDVNLALEWNRRVLSREVPDASLLALNCLGHGYYDTVIEQAQAGDLISQRMAEILQTRRPKSFVNYAVEHLLVTT